MYILLDLEGAVAYTSRPLRIAPQKSSPSGPSKLDLLHWYFLIYSNQNDSSVGYQLLTEGLVFGGSTLTTTDIVVMDDPSLDIGHRMNVSEDQISKDIRQKAKIAIEKLLEDAIDSTYLIFRLVSPSCMFF